MIGFGDGDVIKVRTSFAGGGRRLLNLSHIRSNHLFPRTLHLHSEWLFQS